MVRCLGRRLTSEPAATATNRRHLLRLAVLTIREVHFPVSDAIYMRCGAPPPPDLTKNPGIAESRRRWRFKARTGLVPRFLAVCGFIGYACLPAATC
jgi:hypothetical protein